MVFESDIDLKAHVMEVHMGHASKAELRDMRRVEVNFQYHAPGRGRGRREEERTARDVDISTLRRDEQAYFRIQQAQREQASRQIGNIIIPPVRPRAPGNFPPLSPGAAPESGPGQKAAADRGRGEDALARTQSGGAERTADRCAKRQHDEFHRRRVESAGGQAWHQGCRW